MTTPDPDDVLRAALDDAVSDVEPTDRLGAIRARTARAPRRWRRSMVTGGAALAAAAVVVAVAVVSTGDGERDGVRPGVADPGPTSPATSSDPTADPTALAPPTGPTGPTEVVALYFIGDTPTGPRLFREFRQVPELDPTGYLESVLDALGSPDDPDYRTAWPAGTVIAQVVEGDVRVSLPDDATQDPLALQQLQRTLSAASGAELVIVVPRPPDEGFVIERDDTLLAPISISDPTEGKPVTGRFTARGVADSFEATVLWRVLDPAGTAVASGFATAAGFGRLHPWETTVDVSGLAPGTYTFEASTSDPSDGEGPGATVDTRTITLG